MTVTSREIDPSKRTVQLFRNFRRFQGGHLKVWHYFNHIRSTATHVPFISFEAGSRWDETNPWTGDGMRAIPDKDLDISPDLYFLAGRDWSRLDPQLREHPPVPVINLIQHVRHADAGYQDLFGYLRHRAIRICVDPVVEDVVRDTGMANGPVFTIQNGIDTPPMPQIEYWSRDLDLVIVAIKQPELGKQLHAQLVSSIRIRTVTERVPREDLLHDLSKELLHYPRCKHPESIRCFFGSLWISPICH